MPMDWEEWQRSRENKKPSGGNSSKPGREMPDIFGQFKNLNYGRLIVITLVLAAAIWLLTGFFTVQANEVGLVKRFGAFHRQVGAGLHYHWPHPLESVEKPGVTRVREYQIGVPPSPDSDETKRQNGFLMLTGDENIVDMSFKILYKVESPQKYMFKVADPDKTLRDAAESAVREVVGRNELRNILVIDSSNDFQTVLGLELDANLSEDDASALRNDLSADLRDDIFRTLTAMMVKYETGLIIDNVQILSALPPVEVSPSFKDVASAREDGNTLRNDGKAYASKILPRKEGQAAAIRAQAEAYAVERMNKARGEAIRFTALLPEYRKNPEATRNRLFFEAMDEVIKPAEKFIIDENSGPGVLPHLGLNRPASPRTSPSASRPAEGESR